MKRPSSAVPGYVPLAGLAGAAASWLAIWLLKPSPLLATPLFLLACAAPMWALELKRFPRVDTPVRRGLPPWRFHLRLIGVGSITALLCITLSTYRALSASAIGGLDLLLPLLAPLSAAWILWALWHRPRRSRLDSVERIGKAIRRIGHRHRAATGDDYQCILGWTVKAVFLPLMVSSTYLFLAAAQSDESLGRWSTFALIYTSFFAVDTAFATIGYCSTNERIGAHIRSTEPTLLGWLSALVCYPPLNTIVLFQWLSYQDGYEWSDWLAGSPVLATIWAGAILAMTALYVYATVSFGPRFSNLTNRGIITSGPYRYFKHPSYIGKNAAWWLIAIPFVSTAGAGEAAINCAALLAINLIYVVRAKTEERHLTADPDYREYSQWIATYGLIGRFRKLASIRTQPCEQR